MTLSPADCPQVQCVHPYVAQQPDELTLDLADILNVLDKTEDGEARTSPRRGPVALQPLNASTLRPGCHQGSLGPEERPISHLFPSPELRDSVLWPWQGTQPSWPLRVPFLFEGLHDPRPLFATSSQEACPAPVPICPALASAPVELFINV